MPTARNVSIIYTESKEHKIPAVCSCGMFTKLRKTLNREPWLRRSRLHSLFSCRVEQSHIGLHDKRGETEGEMKAP